MPERAPRLWGFCREGAARDRFGLAAGVLAVVAFASGSQQPASPPAIDLPVERRTTTADPAGAVRDAAARKAGLDARRARVRREAEAARRRAARATPSDSARGAAAAPPPRATPAPAGDDDDADDADDGDDADD